MLALYLIKRLVMALAVLLLILVFLVGVVQLVPGDPARILAERAAGGHPSQEYIQSVRDELKLDEPFTTQFWDFLTGAIRGDFGENFATRIPVTTQITQVLPDTIILAFAGILLSVIVGVPLGVLAARYPNTPFDRALGGFSVILLSGLPYVVGIFLLVVFSVRLHWLPASGSGKLSDPLDYSRHLILPAIALALPWWGYLPRVVRATTLEVMGSPYIRTARALGLGERLVFYKYALKNALVPVVALFGLMLGYFLAGTLYVEIVFSRPGLGSLSINAVTTRDWPVIRATVLLFAFFVIAGNLFSDLSYRFLDPRIRVEEGAEAPG